MMEFNTTKLSNGELTQLTGKLIDIFEDFLERKGIKIENPEKEEAVASGEDPGTIANLYGTDYGELESFIKETLINWELAEPYEY